VTITNEFAIVIEVTRLSCDGLVIIAQLSLCLVTPSPFSSAFQYSQPFFVILNSWLKINTVFKVTPGAWVEAINAFIWWQIKSISLNPRKAEYPVMKGRKKGIAEFFFSGFTRRVL